MRRNFGFGCVFSLFFILFSTQRQVPQKIIGMDRVVFHIKAFSIVIRTTLEIFKCLYTVSRKIGFKFLIFGLTSSLYAVSVYAYNSLFKLTLSRENLVVLK